MANIFSGGACAFSCIKIQLRKLVYAVKDCAARHNGVANGRLAFGSNVSGSISSTDISYHCVSFQLPESLVKCSLILELSLLPR